MLLLLLSNLPVRHWNVMISQREVLISVYNYMAMFTGL